ncbi:MAG: group II intron reverse transcriptase/maturase [Phormidium sp.]
MWREIDWKQAEKVVFKLQKRIYRASNCGDVKTVRRLQKTLIRSWYARLLATRKVTQDNKGKRTAGVDGEKSLTPAARLALAKRLRLTGKSKPTRRVWIPKPGTEEKRPLGIPTMYDRALQALVKLALEPEWEARFEENSYGFRPGRSCHDAIEAIFNAVRSKSKYVLDADIAKCFDKINQDKLLDKIRTYPTLRQQLRAWLKAGVLDGKHLFPTLEGTPQGGIISPLLANIALHGMENRIKQFADTWKGSNKRDNRRSISLIRYADDFVILHHDLAIVQKAKEIIEDWLKDMGLELKASKTRITHTFHRYEGNVGFDFLGFHIRQHAVGSYRSANNPHGIKLGFKTLITPSKESQKNHQRILDDIVDTHKNAPQSALIKELNPVIRGWANYYMNVVSKEIFSKMNHLLYLKLRRWAKRKGKGTMNKNKYWREGWCFKTEDGFELANYAKVKIERHIKVQNDRSPYDGDWAYWVERMTNYPETPTRVARLLKVQKGKCSHCGLYFQSTDLVEVDHIKPRIEGGKDTYENLQLLHRHCHQVKSAIERKTRINDNDWIIEEPDEAKVSRPVL